MAEFDQKYGVAFDTETAEEIERFLSEGDSRSARIRSLVQMGLVAEQEMLDNDYFPPDKDKREEMVKDAMEEYLEEYLS